jgi:acetyl-CoA carboxylase biotin carboxyl carrier protein
MPQAVSPTLAPAHGPSPGATNLAPAETAPATAASNETVIESPMVGTYYASSSPDSPPFVTVGTAVRPETTVCVIEAMKVFTDIPAGSSGTITEVLVKNGQPVEYGQAMFRVRPA